MKVFGGKMGLGISPVGYEDKVTSFASKKTYTYKKSATKNSQPKVSALGNTCTDGKDDGQISTLSKIGCFFKGAVNSVANMVKGAVENPLKTALMIGICCIPVVGKIAMIGMGLFGAFKGVTTVATAASMAGSAKTDAEAKDAWNYIGDGTLTTAASVAMVKGGVNGLKAEFNGTAAHHATADLLKEAWKKTKGESSGLKFGELTKAVGQDTLANVKGVANSARKLCKEGYKKAKGFRESVKTNGLRKTAMDYTSKGAQALSSKVQKVADKIEYKNSNTVSKSTAVEALEEAKMNGYKYSTHLNGLPKEIEINGLTYRFSIFGRPLGPVETSTATATGALRGYASRTIGKFNTFVNSGSAKLNNTLFYGGAVLNSNN